MIKLVKERYRDANGREHDLYISKSDFEYLAKSFTRYFNSMKEYMSNWKDWSIDYFVVPEKDRSTGEIRNIAFTLLFKYKGKNSILVETFVWPEFYETAITCSDLGMNDEYIFKNGSTDDLVSDGFEDITSFEGLLNINIVPTMNKVEDGTYSESIKRSNRRRSKKVNEAYTRVISDESGRMHYAIDSQFEAVRLILSEIKESLDWAERYERKLHNDGSADETLYDVLFNNKNALNKFNDALNDFYSDTFS